MPLKYWDEAFLAATYIINRVPSKVISFETPLERLFHKKPNYPALRTFGCACWPHLRPYNNHKLQFRSKQCVFLGYSQLHKGFKCLDISSGRVYVSRDVIFDETVFPFSQLKSNAGAQLRAEIALLPSDLVAHDQGGEQQSDHVLDFPNATNGLDDSSSSTDFCGTDECVDLTHSATASDGVNGAGNSTPGSVPDVTRETAQAPEQQQHGEGAQPHSARDTSPSSCTSSARPVPHQTVPALGHDLTGTSADTSTDGVAVQDIEQGAEGELDLNRPRTRLQGGIRKPKVYTDGTVRYSCFTSTGEPWRINIGRMQWMQSIQP